MCEESNHTFGVTEDHSEALRGISCPRLRKPAGSNDGMFLGAFSSWLIVYVKTLPYLSQVDSVRRGSYHLSTILARTTPYHDEKVSERPIVELVQDSWCGL